jgi:hypothetical protein
VVKCSTLEELVSSKPYREQMEDYPYVVPEWERQLAIRGPVGDAATTKSAEEGEAGKYKSSTHSPSQPLSKGESLSFSPGTAFVYILEK